MKKIVLSVAFIVLSAPVIFAFSELKGEKEKVSEAYSYSIPQDYMRFERETTAWLNMVDGQGTFWKSWDAQICKDTRNGELWIKIHKIGSAVKGRVQKNPDYTGPMGMGPRKNHKYLTNADDGRTYYFD